MRLCIVKSPLSVCCRHIAGISTSGTKCFHQSVHMGLTLAVITYHAINNDATFDYTCNTSKIKHMTSRAYRAATGGKRACNGHSTHRQRNPTLLKIALTFSEQASTDTFVQVTYGHTKPLFGVPKVQKASPIIWTSEKTSQPGDD